VNSISQLEDHPNKSLRLTAVLVLRRMRDESISQFLDDEDVYIVTEAARAINDDWSIENALPDLAELLQETRFNSEPLLRRAISAASRVGGTREIDYLVEFSGRLDISPVLRAEALAVLGTWASPSVLDRVDGRLRGEVSRDASYVISELRPFIGQYLQSDAPEIVMTTVRALTKLGIKDFTDMQFELARTHTNPEVRAAMISSLHEMEFPEIYAVVQMGMNDQDEGVRTTAMRLIPELDITSENLPNMVSPVFKKGTLREQQQMLHVLGEMSIEKTGDILEDLVKQWIDGKLDAGISLDLIEAIDSTKSNLLIQMIEPLRPSGNTLADYMDVLYGGDSRQGRQIFWSNPSAQCVRCHSWDNKPGSAGPSLIGIADKLGREELLQALIEPSARLSPGFGSVVLTLTDGSRVSGILIEENELELFLKTSNAEPLKIPIQRISKRDNVPSSMPSMGSILSRREIRDLVEFLANLKE